MSYNKNLPDKALIDESNDFRNMLMIGAAMAACLVGGIFIGFAIVNIFMVPGLTC